MKEFITVVSTITTTIFGFIIFVLLLWDRCVRYLCIELRVEIGPTNIVTVMTTVENKGIMKRNLNNAVLLIGPENETPISTVKRIFGSECIKRKDGTTYKIEYTNDIAEICLTETKIEQNGEGRCLIPIPFYYSENDGIGDEKIAYRVPITDTNIFTKGVPYSVRFFIHAKRRLHRTTHDSFVL